MEQNEELLVPKNTEKNKNIPKILKKNQSKEKSWNYYSIYFRINLFNSTGICCYRTR